MATTGPRIDRVDHSAARRMATMMVADADFRVVSAPGAPDYVIKARGEIDLYTGEQLRTVLRDGLASRPVQLIVDIAEVTFIDSSGLGVLVGAFKRAQDSAVGMALRAPSDRVSRVLELTGLLHLFPVVPETGDESQDPSAP